MDGLTFGAFIAAKRRQAGLSQREAAKHLGITAAYLCDIENGKRSAFDMGRLHRFALMTGMGEDEKNRLYDLAGESRGEISPDISAYLSDNAYICAALRTVKKLQCDEDDWKTMLEELKKRKGV